MLLEVQTNSRLYRLLACVAFAACWLAASEAAQPAVAEERQLDPASMQAEMERLAEVCDRLDMTEEADVCRSWLPDSSRKDRRSLFLPSPFPMEKAGTAQAKWRQHFVAARRAHAQWLYDQALQQSTANQEADAYRLLWRTVREDPEHEGASRALGTLLSAVQVRPRVRPSPRPHAKFGWGAAEYSLIQTPHFLLTTRADTRESIAIGQQLEAVYALWTQVFFEQWCAPGILAKRLAGGRQEWPQTRKLEVALLRDREDYLETLGVREQNISVSVGYYNPQAKLSFFYPSDDLEETFQHELTHQLFSEASRLNTLLDAGDAGGIWQLEGIAIYMESLREHDNSGWWTVGGIDVPRMQTARYRAVRDGYWPSWQEFASGTTEQWKQAEDVALRYTHAAGLTHAFLDLGTAETRNAYLAALEDIYTGQPRSSLQLLQQLGPDEEQAKTNYQQRLTITDAQFQGLMVAPSRFESLVLAGSELSADSWQSLSRFSALTWLDLSFANCSTADLASLTELSKLERLSVEGTAVDGGLLPLVARLSLSELDLSGCSITDEDLAVLRGSSIETLWLTKTRVTDACLEVLGQLPKLRTCDIAGTAITPERWQAFCVEHGVNQSR